MNQFDTCKKVINEGSIYYNILEFLDENNVYVEVWDFERQIPREAYFLILSTEMLRKVSLEEERIFARYMKTVHWENNYGK